MSTRVVALMMLAVATTWAQEVPVSDGDDIPVVVLPFTNISGAPADDWLSVGIAETIRVDVSAASGFVSLTSTDVEQVQWPGSSVELFNVSMIPSELPHS